MKTTRKDVLMSFSETGMLSRGDHGTVVENMLADIILRLDRIERLQFYPPSLPADTEAKP